MTYEELLAKKENLENELASVENELDELAILELRKKFSHKWFKLNEGDRIYFTYIKDVLEDETGLGKEIYINNNCLQVSDGSFDLEEMENDEEVSESEVLETMRSFITNIIPLDYKDEA